MYRRPGRRATVDRTERPFDGSLRFAASCLPANQRMEPPEPDVFPSARSLGRRLIRTLGGITLMRRLSFPVWLRSAGCVWAVLAILWLFSCYHFAGGELRVDGWFINCRPGFENGFALFVSVVAVFLLVVVVFVARAIHKRMRHHENAAQPCAPANPA